MRLILTRSLAVVNILLLIAMCQSKIAAQEACIVRNCGVIGPQQVCSNSTSDYLYACSTSDFIECGFPIQAAVFAPDGSISVLSPNILSDNEVGINIDWSSIYSVDGIYEIRIIPPVSGLGNETVEYSVVVTSAEIPLDLPPLICVGESLEILDPESPFGIFNALITSVDNSSIIQIDEGWEISFPNTGSYEICRELTLTIQGSSCKSDICESIEVVSPFDADFVSYGYDLSNDVIEICRGQDVYFENTTAVISLPGTSVPSWSITHPSGEIQRIIAEDLISVNFDQSGTYEILLEVELANMACRPEGKTISVVVDDNLGIEIICPSIVCGNTEVRYEVDNNCTGLVWSIDSNAGVLVPDGNENDNGITVLWNSTTDYTIGYVSVTAASCMGVNCLQTSTTYVPIFPTGASIEGPDQVCNTESVVYTLPDLPGALYEWNLIITSGAGGTLEILNGANTSSTVVLDIPANFVGEVELSVAVEQGLLGCMFDSERDIQISNFQVAGNTSICRGDVLYPSFSPSSVIGDVTYEAYNASGDLVDSGNLTDGIPTMGLVGGSYDVTIIYNGTLNACETGFRFSVLDPSAVTGIIGADEVCLNVPYQYSVAAPQASGRYDWAVTGATVAILSGSTIQVEFTSAGTKSLEVTYTEFADDGSTCTSPPLTKQIETLISPPDDIAGPDAPCPDSRSTYSVLFSGATQYQWSILDNNGSVTPLGSVVEGQGTNVIDVQWLQVSVVTPVIIQLTYILCPGGTAVVKDYNVLITPFELALDGPAEICEGEEAMFTLNIDPANNNQGNATWYVDGILIVNGPPVNRNFEIPGEPGLHEVSVIVTDGNGCPGVTQATVTINVISSPNPTISLSTPDICDKNGNVVVDLLVTPSNAESYVWTTPSGQIDQGTNPELPVTEVGVYTVTVTNSNCTGVASITVEKEPNVACECEIPDANDITVEIINATSSGCSTISVVGNSNITDGRPGSVFWRLQGPNGQSELSSVINEDDLFETFSVSLPGRYFIYLVASEQCSDMMSSCSERAVAIVDIPFTPDFSANFSCATSTMGTYDLILEDQSLYSSVADLELVSWKINWPGMTASPTGQNVTLSDLPGGTTVNVCQTLESTNGYSCDECRDVTIPNDIMGDFTYDNMADCTGEIIDFVPQIDATEVESILWNFGDGTTSQILMPSKVYNMAGDYTVTLTLTSVFGCDFVSTRTVTVSTPSVMSGQIEAVSDFCETTASLSFQTSDMSPVMYEWSTGETTASIEATISGVYSLTVTDESGCSYIPDPVGVTIIESFLSEISNPGEVCSGEMFSAFVFSSGINKTIYRWEVSNEEGTVEPVGSGTSFNASLTDAGTYTISFILEREGVVCQSVETTIVVHPAPDQPIITDVTQCNPFSTILTTQYAGIDWSTNRQPPFVTASSITAARSNLTYWGTVSNDFGCSAEASFTGDFPDLDMFQSGCFTLCSDSLIGLTLDGIPGSFTSWEWVLTNPETGIEEIIEGGTGEITPLILSEVSEGEITLRIVFGDCTLETESFCMKLEDCDTECFLEEDDFKIAAMDCYLNDPTLSDYYVFYLSGRIDLPNGYDLCEEDQSILSYPLGTADWTSFRIRGNSNGMRLELAGFYYIPVADYETYQTEGFSIIVELCDAAGNICLLPVNVSSMECGSLTVECEIGEIKADCVSWPGRDPVCFLQYTNNLYFVTGPSCDITDWTVESYGRTASGERVLLQVDYVSGTPIESRSYTQVAYMSEADYGSYVSYEVLTYHNCQTSDDACVRTLNTSKGSKSLAIQEAQVPSLTLFPNPTTSLLTVDVGTQQVIDQYTVLTLSGKQVAMDDGVKKTSTTFSVSSMPPGVYMVRLVTTDGSVYTRRFVVAR